MKYEEKTTLEMLKALRPDSLVVYAMGTCWWNAPDHTEVWYKTQGTTGLPCDPRGSMLLQGELGKFIACAEESPSHYGKHGLKAFVAAFHGNVLTDEGNPTSFQTWDEYNQLIDEAPNAEAPE